MSIKRLILIFSAVVLSLIVPYKMVFADVTPTGNITDTNKQVVSGKFSIIVETTGKVKGIYYWLESPNSGKSVPYQVPINSRNPYYSSSSSWGFIWDTTQVPNGTYNWTASLVCDSGCTADLIKTLDNKYSLTVTVDNPTVTPTTTQPVTDNGCNDKISQVNAIASTIQQKEQSRLLFVDNFSKQVQAYYTREKLTIANYDSLVKVVNDNYKKASDSVVLLQHKSAMDCISGLKSQVNDFKSQLGTTRVNIDAYKDSIINLIMAIIV